ncbi:hypothetical protein PISMIDRAFT_689254 [Pisolithus microcarpus 441]|uniref:Uncharacterized protein n=1 Tax=Pisolithus microcarpus 441 TaxID=765257 RepID=A0A0C9Y708_9AGAM|nr:hypothetical protein BKA83DRAFT_689254 [Pisolithus microcarpus]KIK12726.1 hypothetical protein PISMIDRAFT_689254 [Pisolithus microcarpus 441]
MTTPPFLGRAPPIRSTVQHSWGSACRGDCHLEHKHHTTVPRYEFATVDGREPQCLESSTGDGYSVSVPRALQLPSCPIIPAPLPTFNSSPAGCICGEPDTAQVPLSLGYYVASEKSIGHTSDYITNHDTTLFPSYTSLLPSYAIEQSSGHLRESEDISTFGYLDSNFAGPTMGPGSIPSLCDRTSGQVIGLDAPWPWIADPLLPLLQEPHPLDNFTYGNIPLPPEQTRITMQPTEQIHPWAPFPYANPIPFQSNSTSYSTSDRYISSQNASSWFPQEHFGYPLPVHPHDVRPVYLPGFHGIDTGSKIELHVPGTLDHHAAQIFGDHPSHTLSDHETRLLRSHATYMPDDHTTGGGVDDYRNFDESEFNSERVAGLSPRLPLPPNRLPPSPRRSLSHDRASRVKRKTLSRPFYHTSRPASARSRPTRLPKARSARCHNGSIPCGWRDDGGKECCKPISYGNCTDHFASAHGITNIACTVKVICYWCPSELQRVITRKNFMRHVKEVHLCYARSENGN